MLGRFLYTDLPPTNRTHVIEVQGTWLDEIPEWQAASTGVQWENEAKIYTILHKSSHVSIVFTELKNSIYFSTLKRENFKAIILKVFPIMNSLYCFEILFLIDFIFWRLSVNEAGHN